MKFNALVAKVNKALKATKKYKPTLIRPIYNELSS